MKTALAIVLLIIFSNVMIGEIAYKNGQLKKIDIYAAENFNLQVKCSSAIGDRDAQIGYLETLTAHNF